MRMHSNRKSVYYFAALGGCLVALAIALNIGWIVLNLRQFALLIFGVIFFTLIIVGVALNTIFLIREIRRNEQHDSFINAVTHELKTPIASIRLYLETLMTREVDDEKRKEFYRIMLEDNDRLLHTVEQVLRASRTGHRSRQLHQTVIDMPELVRECLELARTRTHLDEKSLRYVNYLQEGEKALVRGDIDELRAAVSNLIDNAIKYSHEEIDIAVEVSTWDPDKVSVRVIDRGIGIPRREINQVFQRFYRVPIRFQKKTKGTGLGLFIVRSVINKHGGKTFAESRGEGLGSTFTIQLPRISE
jgi:signal transduction histidine kinase